MCDLERLFVQGVEYFNKGYYFEAHDTFEEIWMAERGQRAIFFQGLVQLATGFYHRGMDNYKGAESQLSKALQKLARFQPEYNEIDLVALIGEVQSYLDPIRELQGDVGMETKADFLPAIKIKRG